MPASPEPTVPVSSQGASAFSGANATRRTLLRSAGLVALAGGSAATLGACASDTATAPAGSPSAAAPSASSASPSASASASASASESASASASSAAPAGPSVPAADVPVGGGAIMQDGDYVVTQPEKGTYKAFSKICTHQRCPVSEIDDKGILCKCHNSVFSISDGSPQSGPAKTPLAPAKAVLSGDKIVVSA